MVVVKDFSSRFSVAKIVSSTSKSKVLPDLGNIYDAYGNPKKQVSANFSPFNSKDLKHSKNKQGTQMQPKPLLHLSSNPEETFMKPLRKTMRIVHFNRTPEDTVLRQLLQNCRDTSHPATVVFLQAKLLHDSMKSVFPRAAASEEEIEMVRKRDMLLKCQREQDVNSNKFHRRNTIKERDIAIKQNHQRKKKFDPN